MSSIVSWVSAILLLLMLAGCGARKEYGISDVRLERTSWDSLSVAPVFFSRTTIGPVKQLMADELSVLTLSAAYDTLYAGSDKTFLVDDRALGDREGIIVEVCGRFGTKWICTQEGLRASPKRVLVTEHIVYPLDSSFNRGRYALDVRVERERFGGDTWEEVDFSGQISGYLEAFVEGNPEESVQIPFSSPRGHFDFSRLENYQDFRFHLDSRLMDHQEADVRFNVYGGIDGTTALLASVNKSVSAVTREERLANVQGFARQTARIIVGELSSFLGGRRTLAAIDSWHYDDAENQYVVEIEVSWRGSFFDGREYRIEGELSVGEDGSRALFRMMGGNSNGVDRWNQRLRSTEFPLGTLEVERPRSRYRPGGRRLSTSY